MKMSLELTTRRPHDLRHESVVQVLNVGSLNAALGVNGFRAFGFD